MLTCVLGLVYVPLRRAVQNPTQDTQAEDRAYRIGQTGKVEVSRKQIVSC